MRTRRALAALLLALGVILAGCGTGPTLRPTPQPTFHVGISYPQFQTPVVTDTTTPNGWDQGDVLSTTNGGWTGSPTSYAYQWEDCNTQGSSCSVIGGATSSTYALASGDIGDTVRSVVTASNAHGSATATSGPTGVVAANADYYVAQSASGSGNGSSCANAEAVSTLTPSTHWTAGNVIGLCGTITSDVTAAGSGSSGNPIVLYFEPGASISQPACSSACLTLNNESYITVNGGQNGVIQNTANGTGLADNVADNGISATNCNNCTIENLTIQNIYVRLPDATVTGNVNGTTTVSSVSSFPANLAVGDNVYGTDIPANDTIASLNSGAGTMTLQTAASGTASGVSITASDVSNNGAGSTGCLDIYGSNDVVADNTMDYAHWCVYSAPSATTSNMQFYGNNISETDHGFALDLEGSGGAGVGPLYYYGNDVHDYAAWDSEPDDFHHDGFHAFSNGSGYTIGGGLYIYNNVWGGNVGANDTAQIYLSGSPTISGPTYVFNNVVEASASGQPGNDYFTLSQGGDYYNNTILGGGGSCVNYNDDSGFTATFENNLISDCFQYIGNSGGNGSMTTDYNLYASDGDASSVAFNCSGSGAFAFSAFSSWQSCIAGDSHASTTSASKTNSNGTLQTGSPATGAGTNLYSVCNGQPNPGLGALCSNIAGVARPSSGAWNIGAY